MNKHSVLGMPDDRRWLFLDEVFLSNSISAALGRSGTYKKDGPKNADVLLGSALRAELRKLAACYSGPEGTQPVGPEEHIQKIAALVEAIKTSCAACLEDGSLRFGVAHKALNVYLKFLWCEGRIPMPPHCPFHGEMIAKLKLPTGCERRWTHGTEKDYRAWITAAEIEAGTEPLARWELCLWTRSAPVALGQTA